MTCDPASDLSAVRRFNRFYTRQIGVLRKNLSRQPLLARRNAGAVRDRVTGEAPTVE